MWRKDSSIGYAARQARHLRYDGDNREFRIDFSAQLQADLLELLDGVANDDTTLSELRDVLRSMED